MFRELARKKKEIPFDECVKILIEGKRGVLSVIGDDNYPYGMPMNHFYNNEDGCIYFHSGREGHRNDALNKYDKVCFTICDDGYREEGEWALNIRSVIVFGRMEIIDDLSVIARISTMLSYKFTSDDEYIKNEIENYAKNTFLLKLTPEHMCGKIVKEA